MLAAAAWLAAIGVVLGIAAGVVQTAAGDVIPEWTGDKNDWVLLGLATIGLSIVAAVCLWQVRRARSTWAYACLVVIYLAAVVVCFTTVGRLWYLPGPLLLLALVLQVAADGTQRRER